MIRFGSNANAVSRRYKRRARAVERGTRAGLRRIAEKIDIEQEKNLRGPSSAPPGSYPVPIRSGNLRQSTFSRVQSSRLAVVGNAAAYAALIHGDRPFLADAVNAVDAPLEMSEALRREVYAV